MKKAQINQVFTTIFALLIIGLVVIFAVKGLGGLFKNKCDADFVTFSSNLKSVASKYNSYGVTELHKMLSPCNYEVMCIISGEINNTAQISGLTDDVDVPSDMKSYMKASISGGQLLKNVFLYDNDVVIDAGLITQFRIEEPQKYICIERKNNRFDFYTLGQGQYMYVKTS